MKKQKKSKSTAAERKVYLDKINGLTKELFDIDQQLPKTNIMSSDYDDLQSKKRAIRIKLMSIKTQLQNLGKWFELYQEIYYLPPNI